jgi:hypothetical protein
MPTNRKRIRRTHKKALSGDELEIHIHGYSMLDRRKPIFKTDKDRFASWRTHREYIMQLQGQRVRGESFGLTGDQVYFEMGTRPASWWAFDAPEPRRLLSGDPSGALPEHGFSRGIPKRFRSHEAFQSMRYETEQAFLQRHGLLGEQEKQQIERRSSNGKTK